MKTCQADQAKLSALEEVLNFIEDSLVDDNNQEPVLVDVFVSTGVHEFFKRMSNLFGHKANKARVLDAMLIFDNE